MLCRAVPCCADLDIEDLLVAQRGVAGQHLIHHHHLQMEGMAVGREQVAVAGGRE